MNIVRFPIEEVSADYGDIIVESVSNELETIISIEGNEVLHEVYSPDVNGVVYIRDVGSLAMMYDNVQPLSLDGGVDGKYVKLDIFLKEGDDEFNASASVYRCDAESGNTLAVGTLKRMPLSRLTKKTTSIGRSEFISFYGSGEIMADVVFYGKDRDEIKSVVVGNIAEDNGSYFRYDVSPSVIATLCGIAENLLISYTIYKNENDTISFVVNPLPSLNSKTFIFRNVFGAQESFTCTGDAVTEEKWTRTYGYISRYQIQISRDLNKSFSVNTGYLSREMVGVVEDLLNSQHVCLVEDGALRNITISEESFKVSSRKDELISIEFKYRFASNNQSQLRLNKKRLFDFTFDNTFN